jgi:hypothetical protein
MSTQELAEYIYLKHSSINDKSHHHYHELIVVPIYKIDNLRCETRISLSKTSIRFYIETNDYIQTTYDDDDEPNALELYSIYINLEGKEINTELFKTCIDKWFLVDIPELKFNKVNSRFEKEIRINMWEFLKEIPNMSQGDECCVCQEVTRFKTCCGHTICIPCLTQIKEVQDDDNEEHYHKICPICRNTITM